MILKRPCGCNRYQPGHPYVEGRDCRLCWKYHQNMRFHKAHGGKGQWLGGTIVEGDFPQASPSPTPPQEGPGTELKSLLSQLGLVAGKGCACNSKAAQMNEWGAEGCKARRGEIVGWLEEQRRKQGWGQILSSAVLALKAGIFLNPLDPVGSLVDLAIQRSEGKLSGP